jgi:hypothetical protein
MRPSGLGRGGDAADVARRGAYNETGLSLYGHQRQRVLGRDRRFSAMATVWGWSDP